VKTVKMISQTFPVNSDESTKITDESHIQPQVAVMVKEMRAKLEAIIFVSHGIAKRAKALYSNLPGLNVRLNGIVFQR